MIEFAYPWLLLLLLLLPLIGVYCVYRQKQPSITVSTVAPFESVRAARRPGIPLTCMLLALGVTIVALARPRIGNEKFLIRSQGIDIVLAIDLSGSMAAYDVPPEIRSGRQLVNAIKDGSLKNRLDVAKDEIRKFIEARPNDRIGLVGFAEAAYNLAPPTLDHAWLLANLENLDAGIIGDKTNIAAPITSAVQRLKDSDARRKIIVLFTDGSNNVEAKVTPLQAAKLANTFDITVYTVGIGSPVSVAPVETFAGRRYEQIQSDFDESLLRQIAEDSGGKYYKAEDSDSMAAAMKAIDSLEKTSFEQQTLVNWRELAPGFTAASLILLLLAFLLENTVMKRIP